MVIVALASCSKPSPKEVFDKIQAGEELEEVDYTVMGDYLDDFCDEMKASAQDYESGFQIGQKYKYWIIFAMAIENGSDVPSSARQAYDRVLADLE